MPKKKEEPEVTAAVETTESTAEVTDIEPVPVEPAAEVPAEVLPDPASRPSRLSKNRRSPNAPAKRKRMPWTRKLYPSLNRLPPRRLRQRKKKPQQQIGRISRRRILF